MAATGFHFSPRPNRAAEIDWRPWGEDAFAEARRTGKPVLLAISAVWCHWCHVMDETSYSDGAVIGLANERYVPIRVDNDERPDINRRYNMGGWPSTAFLTPDGDIIHGGTYVPPEQMRGLLGQIADLWRDKRDELTARVAEIRAKEDDGRGGAPGDLSWEIVDAVASTVRGQYDPQFGGFGRDQKFPQPNVVRFVLNGYRRHATADAAAMLHTTLGAMASGGMYDHVEGGFFRYSTTRDWSVPHFEKMLEDNAELLKVYAEAHRTFPSAGYDRVVRDVVRWMDSSLWRGDVGALAGSQDADERYYELGPAERAVHGAPFVDRTLYTAWNALAASGYLAAASALDDAAARERAVAILEGLTRRMRAPDGALFHFDRGGGPVLADQLADLAALLVALLDAHEQDARRGSLEQAIEVAGRMRVRLAAADGGFFDTPESGEPGRLARRERPIEENARAADALIRLASLSGDTSWREAGEATLRAFVTEYRRWGQFAASYADAVARALLPPASTAVVGPAGDARADALWSVARRGDDPAGTRQRIDPIRDEERLRRVGYPDRVAAYVCIGTVCSAPLDAPAELEAELARALARLERAPA